jgi:membrane protein YqaA with SNARE-associated domain
MSVETIGGIFLGTLVSGVVPLVNAELPVVAAAGAAATGAWLPSVAVVAVVSAAGQMTSKTVTFGVARWAPARLPRKAQAVIAEASARASDAPTAVWTSILASAATGVPPFYGTAIAAGALGVRAVTSVAFGFLGRLARFGVLALGAGAAGARFLDGPLACGGPMARMSLAVLGR